MPDDSGRWRADERQDWTPDGPCPNCGSMKLQTGWAPATTMGDLEPFYVPYGLECSDCHHRS